MLTDLKHGLWHNCLYPEYRPELFADASEATRASAPLPPAKFVPLGGALSQFGNDGEGFCYDNELPRHQQGFGGLQAAAPSAVKAFVPFPRSRPTTVRSFRPRRAR
jgi:hypothetical protein